MSSLNAFLHPEQVENKAIIVSERFKEDGKPVPFIIRPITQKENESIVRKHTKKDKKGNETFDRISYIQELTATGVVFPDLQSVEIQKAYGVLGADKVLPAMLYVGEFTALMQEVQGLSGLDIDINEDIEEAKKLIKQGDPELNYAHFALQKLHIRAGVLAGICGANEPMGQKERAFTYASIDLRIAEEKREVAKLKG